VVPKEFPIFVWDDLFIPSGWKPRIETPCGHRMMSASGPLSLGNSAETEERILLWSQVILLWTKSRCINKPTCIFVGKIEK